MRVQKVAGHVLPGVHDDQRGLPGAQPINERVLLFPGDRKSLPIQDRVPFPVQCEVGSRPRRNIETRAFGSRGQKMSRNQETRHRHNQQKTPTPTKNAQQQQGCSTTPSWDRDRTNLASPATAHPPPRTIKRSSSPPHMRGVPARPDPWPSGVHPARYPSDIPFLPVFRVIHKTGCGPSRTKPRPATIQAHSRLGMESVIQAAAGNFHVWILTSPPVSAMSTLID